MASGILFFLPLSSVLKLKGKLSEEEGRRLFQQLIDAVSYCHDKGVYHRDLKVISPTTPDSSKKILGLCGHLGVISITARKCACRCKRRHKDFRFWPQCFTSASWGMSFVFFTETFPVIMLLG